MAKKRSMLMIAAAMVAVPLAVAFAGKLEDFKDADRYSEGCDTIPNTGDQCISYRKAVLNSFASALDKMRNESETPDIKTVAESLVRKYEASKSGHGQQVTIRENAMKICKDARP